MSKYEPLTAFLKSKHGREIRMSFAEVEKVIGEKLPAKSKANRAWWSNNPSNSVMTKAWLAAGYKSAQVDMGSEKLTFVPSVNAQGFGERDQIDYHSEEGASLASRAKTAGRHPAFGALKGMITLLPDVDYAEPADPDWGKVYED